MSYATFVAAIVSIMVMLTVFSVRKGVETIDGMIVRAGETARAERDAHWQAEISKSNAEAAKAQADAAEQVVAVNADADRKIAMAERQALEARKDNDALPDDGSCGLSAGRVELLNR